MKKVEFRHQPTGDAVMMAIYSSIHKKEIVRAIRAFWNPFAYEQQEDADPLFLMAIARESAAILEAQALLIRQRYRVDALPSAPMASLPPLQVMERKVEEEATDDWDEEDEALLLGDEMEPSKASI